METVLLFISIIIGLGVLAPFVTGIMNVWRDQKTHERNKEEERKKAAAEQFKTKLQNTEALKGLTTALLAAHADCKNNPGKMHRLVVELHHTATEPLTIKMLNELAYRITRLPKNCRVFFNGNREAVAQLEEAIKAEHARGFDVPKMRNPPQQPHRYVDGFNPYAAAFKAEADVRQWENIVKEMAEVFKDSVESINKYHDEELAKVKAMRNTEQEPAAAPAAEIDDSARVHRKGPETSTGLNIGAAMDQAKAGKAVRRAAWNKQFVVYMEPGLRDVEAQPTAEEINGIPVVCFRSGVAGCETKLPVLCAKSGGEVVVNWGISHEDQLAEDWEVAPFLS